MLLKSAAQKRCRDLCTPQFGNLVQWEHPVDDRCDLPVLNELSRIPRPVLVVRPDDGDAVRTRTTIRSHDRRQGSDIGSGDTKPIVQ